MNASVTYDENGLRTSKTFGSGADETRTDYCIHSCFIRLKCHLSAIYGIIFIIVNEILAPLYSLNNKIHGISPQKPLYGLASEFISTGFKIGINSTEDEVRYIAETVFGFQLS
jgi:hypothetical protein